LTDYTTADGQQVNQQQKEKCRAYNPRAVSYPNP